MNTIKEYLRLMRFDKPVGFWLLLWPTYWGLWIAVGHLPHLHYLIIFTLGVIIMRSAGCVINDILDRKFDPHVTRTQNRPLATQALSLKQAISLFLILSVFALGLALELNFLALEMALLGMIITVCYPLLKRITSLPQAGMSLAFSWGIILAFAAEINHLSVIAWLLFSANALWIIVYDTEYAMTDRLDDLKIGVKSTAILFGSYVQLILAILQIATLIILASVGYILAFNRFFYICLVIGGVCFIYHQYLIFDYHPERCLKAFRHNHWFGFWVFLGILIQYPF